MLIVKVRLLTQVYGNIETTPTGVDQCVAITLKYPGQRVAQLMCGTCLEPTKEAVVIGTKGTLKLPARFWCPTKLETPSVSY